MPPVRVYIEDVVRVRCPRCGYIGLHGFPATLPRPESVIAEDGVNCYGRIYPPRGSLEPQFMECPACLNENGVV